MAFTFIPIRAGIQKKATSKAASKFSLVDRATIAAARLKYEPKKNAAEIIALAAPIYDRHGLDLPQPDYGDEKFADLKDKAKKDVRQATSLMQSVSGLSLDVKTIYDKLMAGTHPRDLSTEKMKNKKGKAKTYSERDLFDAVPPGILWSGEPDDEQENTPKHEEEAPIAAENEPTDEAVAFDDLPDDEPQPEAIGVAIKSVITKKKGV